MNGAKTVKLLELSLPLMSSNVKQVNQTDSITVQHFKALLRNREIDSWPTGQSFWCMTVGL